MISFLLVRYVKLVSRKIFNFSLSQYFSMGTNAYFIPCCGNTAPSPQLLIIFLPSKVLSSKAKKTSDLIMGFLLSNSYYSKQTYTGHLIDFLEKLNQEFVVFILVMRKLRYQKFKSFVQCCVLNWVGLFAVPWTVAHQAPLLMGFPRQKYWSGLPFPPPGDLPNPGIEPVSPVTPALAGRFFTTESPGMPICLKLQ